MSRLSTVLAFAAEQGFGTEQAFDNTWITVPSPKAHDLIKAWKAEGFNYLANITGIDYLTYPEKKPERFCVVYEMVSMPGYKDGDGSRFFVKVFLSESHASTKSLTDLWKGADWLEREIFDLLGIKFEGHPDMRKILTPEDLDGHPLRKDFPLGETPTLFKEGRFIDPASFRAGMSGNNSGKTGWRGGSRKGYENVADEVQKVVSSDSSKGGA